MKTIKVTLTKEQLTFIQGELAENAQADHHALIDEAKWKGDVDLECANESIEESIKMRNEIMGVLAEAALPPFLVLDPFVAYNKADD